MLCMLTVRRLKPGAEEAFARAWAPERWHARMNRHWMAAEERRLAGIAPLEEAVVLTGVFEVVESAGQG
jgi:hypothetical protein